MREREVVMSKNWIMLTGLLLLGSVVPSQAHPLDAPDIVYVDGLPCNNACQIYLAWSRRKTSFAAQHSAPVESATVESPPLKLVPETPALRSARGAVRHARAVHRDSSKPAARRIAKRAAPLSPAKIATPKPASETAVNSEPAPTIVAASPPPDAAAVASEPTATGAQVAAATPPVEQVTVESAPMPQQEATSAESTITTGSDDSSDTAGTPPVPPTSNDNRVAVVMTRPEIESLSDLAGKDVAIEEQQSASSTSIKAAIASAGAAEVKLNEGSGRAIDRLINGEVPAAVLAIASPDAAEQVPEMPGFRIFRIPLSPG
jgi:hypothetical protein